MKDHPCYTCIVSPCCKEVCEKLAKYWSIIYTEYKNDPEETIRKYRLNKKYSNTLKILHKSAGDNEVDFLLSGEKIHIRINFSIFEKSHNNLIPLLVLEIPSTKFPH